MNANPTTIKEVVQAARAQFGDVMSVTLIEQNGFADFYFVACKRTYSPTGEARRYMTITARADNLAHESNSELAARHGITPMVSFHHGNYDMTIDALRKTISKVQPCIIQA